MPHVDSRALLLLPPGTDYVVALFACLLARVTAVPPYPPRKNASFERIARVTADCHATVVIADRTIYQR